jgi:hypothetical protein
MIGPQHLAELQRLRAPLRPACLVTQVVCRRGRCPELLLPHPRAQEIKHRLLDHVYAASVAAAEVKGTATSSVGAAQHGAAPRAAACCAAARPSTS